MKTKAKTIEYTWRLELTVLNKIRLKTEKKRHDIGMTFFDSWFGKFECKVPLKTK